MKKDDFDVSQLDALGDFIKAGKRCTKECKINASHLLYIISKLPGKKGIYTKANLILLRDTLPKRKRIHLDYLLRMDED